MLAGLHSSGPSSSHCPMAQSVQPLPALTPPSPRPPPCRAAVRQRGPAGVRPLRPAGGGRAHCHQDPVGPQLRVPLRVSRRRLLPVRRARHHRRRWGGAWGWVGCTGVSSSTWLPSLALAGQAAAVGSAAGQRATLSRALSQPASPTPGSVTFVFPVLVQRRCPPTAAPPAPSSPSLSPPVWAAAASPWTPPPRQRRPGRPPSGAPGAPTCRSGWQLSP